MIGNCTDSDVNTRRTTDDCFENYDVVVFNPSYIYDTVILVLSNGVFF